MDGWKIAAAWGGQPMPERTRPEAAASAEGEAAGEARAVLRTKEAQQAESLPEKLREAREKAQQRRDSLTVKTDPQQYGDAAMMAYARLARARSQSQVSAAAGYARRQIVRMQAALRTDSDNGPRIKAAIRQLQKAVGRAGRKKRDLQREEQLRARQRKALLEEQYRKAAALRQERESRQAQRSIRENGYLREAEIDDRLQSQLAQTRMELRQQAEQLSAAIGPRIQAAEAGYAGMAAQEPPAPATGWEA